jgi:tRNA-dihydrouridine synthase A
MMDWTDRHCRFFHRLITREARLYSEMVTTAALIHGDPPRHLDFNPEEHPLALQLGGNDPHDLARSARWGEQWGYDEINLNCGCPSDRVQKGVFGACLMAQPQRVADSVKAMVDAVQIPVTVKHRIGLDRSESYSFVQDFVGTVSQAGCSVFIVHARNAWLDGLSPKENREIPPLKREWATRLKKDFPNLTIVLNGALESLEDVQTFWGEVDGFMVGRSAYHNPWWMREWDASVGKPLAATERIDVEISMVRYMEQQAASGFNWYGVARHMLGLWTGQPGARKWRQVWSDHRLKSHSPSQVHELATRARFSATSQTESSAS